MVFSYFVMQIEEFVVASSSSFFFLSFFFSFFPPPADTNGIKGEKRYENEITKLHTHQDKMPRNRAKKRGVKVEIFGNVGLCWGERGERRKKKIPASCWF